VVLHKKKPVYGVMNSIFDIHSIGLLKYIELGIVKPVYDLDIMLQNHFTMSRLQHDHASHVKNTLDPIQHEVYQFIAEHHECDLQNLLNHTTYTMDSIQTALSYLEISDLIFQSKP
jgi:predicted Rossmann fold nucleotide-binding protein DprA/Smf involved in DNA uptake